MKATVPPAIGYVRRDSLDPSARNSGTSLSTNRGLVKKSVLESRMAAVATA
jgi:hypothetical protein